MFSLLYVNKQHQSGVVPLQIMPSSAREQQCLVASKVTITTWRRMPKCWREPCHRKDANVKGGAISFYINIFFLYVAFMLDESYTLSRFFIPTDNGFQKKLKSLICIIHLLYFVSSIRIGTMFDISSNLCLFFFFCILFVTIIWTVVFCFCLF